MTTPITHGYPDWGRFAARADVIYNIEAGTVAPNPVVRGPFFVGNVQTVGFYFQVTAGAATVLLEWYDSAALTNLITLETWEFSNGNYTQSGIGVKGPYLYVSILDGGVGVTFTLRLWASSSQWTWDSGAGGVQLATRVNQAIGAGAVVNTDTVELHRGSATWSGWHVLGAFVATLQAIDINGVVTYIDGIAAGAGYFNRIVSLPPSLVRVSWLNQGGAATTFSTFLNKLPHQWAA